jgi:hypothetical protein
MPNYLKEGLVETLKRTFPLGVDWSELVLINKHVKDEL